MDYCFENKYAMFMEQQIQQQADMDRYIQECIILANPNESNNKIAYLNEAAGEKIKEGFKKFLNFIKTIWAKFLEKLNHLVLKNKNYLEKYKDIILNKKLKEGTYTMYNYPRGVKNLVSTTVPMFNYPQLKEKLDDSVGFNRSLVEGKEPKFNPDIDFTDYCKILFRGSEEEIEIKSGDLNMEDIYNYCYYYKDMEAKIKKDSATIENAVTASINLINSLENKQKNEEAKDNNAAKTESANIYSTVYGQYIMEVDRELEKDNDDKSDSSNNNDNKSTPVTNPAAATKNIEGEKASNDDTKAAVGEEIKEAQHRIDNYNAAVRTLLAAKMTIAEQIYKDYMQIIRTHVKDFVGTDDAKKKDKIKDKGTDYNNKDSGKEETNDQSSNDTNSDGQETSSSGYEKLSDPQKQMVDMYFKGQDGLDKLGKDGAIKQIRRMDPKLKSTKNDLTRLVNVYFG